MPRKPRQQSERYPVHVSARCINKDWFRLSIQEVWSIFCDYLYFTKHAFNLEILNFVLMDNHFHLMVQTPEANLSEAMNYLMREISKEITRNSGRINQTFGGPFHSSLIKSNHHFLHVYKYVYRNPIEAGLCSSVEDYQYSTLNGLLGLSPLYIPVSEDLILFSDIDGTLNWLNTPYKDDDRDKVKMALKKSEFAFLKRNGYLDSLETEKS